MKLCEQCLYSKLVQKPNKTIRFCKRFEDQEPLCINERTKDGKCGEEGKFWARK